MKTHLTAQQDSHQVVPTGQTTVQQGRLSPQRNRNMKTKLLRGAGALLALTALAGFSFDKIESAVQESTMMDTVGGVCYKKGEVREMKCGGQVWGAEKCTLATIDQIQFRIDNQSHLRYLPEKFAHGYLTYKLEHRYPCAMKRTYKCTWFENAPPKFVPQPWPEPYGRYPISLFEGTCEMGE